MRGNPDGPFITDQANVSLPLTWPDDPVLLARAEHQAVQAAQSIADIPHEVWATIPQAHSAPIGEIIRGLEAHWTDPATRPAAVEGAIRSFRGR